MNPFMLMAAKKSQQSPVDAEGLFDKLQGKERDPLTEATFKGDAKGVKRYSDRKKAAERAQRGDTETLTQKAIRTQGTWENAVARARKALKIKPGNDQLLKSALFIAKDVKTGEVSAEDYQEVIRLMKSDAGKKELQARIERFRNPVEDEVTIDAQSPEQQAQSKAASKERKYQEDLNRSGLGTAFRTLEETEQKIQANPFLQMAAKKLGQVSEASPLGTAVNALGGDYAGFVEDTAKGAVSGTLTTPGRVPANLMKLVSGVSPEQKAYAVAELAVDLLDVGGLSFDILKANKAAIKDVLEEAIEQVVKQGDAPVESIRQVSKAIDELPEEQLQEAVNYTFRKASPGGEVGVEFRKPNTVAEGPRTVQDVAIADDIATKGDNVIGATQTKEPWEMTREEFKARFSEASPETVPAIKRMMSQYEAQIASGDRVDLYPEAVLAQKGINPGEHPMMRQYSQGESMHRASIASALKEGKPVPAEVLADYPDLAKKYQTTKVDKPLTETPNIVDDVQRTVNDSEIPNSSDIPKQESPDFVSPVEPTLRKRIADGARQRIEDRAAKRAQMEAEGIVEARSGFSDDDFLDLVDKVIVFVDDLASWSETKVRSFLKTLGAEDQYDAIKKEVELEYARYAEPANRATVAETDRAAKEFGFEQPDLTPRTSDDIMQDVVDKDLVNQVESLADRVMQGEVLGDAERHALATAAQGESRNLKSIAGSLSKAKRTGADKKVIDDLQTAFDDAFVKAEKYSVANRLNSRRLGQALRSIQNDPLADMYSPEMARELAKAKSKDGNIPKWYQDELDNLTGRLAEAEAEIEKLVATKTPPPPKQAAETVIRRTPRAKGSSRKAAAVQKAAVAKDRLSKAWASGNFFEQKPGVMGMNVISGPSLTQEAKEAIKDLAIATWESGVATLDDVVKAVLKTAEDAGIEGLDEQAVYDSIAYTRPKREVAAEVANLRKQKAELLKEAKAKSTKGKEIAQKRAEIASAKKNAREAKKEIDRLNKAAQDLDNAADAERAAKLAEDEKYWNNAVKTLTRQAEKDFGREWRFFDRVFELENQIDDLNDQLQTGVFRHKPNPIKSEKDPLLAKLEAERDELQNLVRRKIAAAAPTGNWEFARLFARGLGFTNPIARLFDVTSNTAKYIYESAFKPVDKLIEKVVFPNMEKSSMGWGMFTRSRQANGKYLNDVWSRMSRHAKTGDPGLLGKIDIRKESNLGIRGKTDKQRKVLEFVDNVVNGINRTPGYTDIPFHQRAFDISLVEGIDNEVAYMAKKNGWNKAQELDFRAKLEANEDGLLDPIIVSAQEIADELVWSNTNAFDVLLANTKGAAERALDKLPIPSSQAVMFGFDTMITRYPTIFAKILGYSTDHIAGAGKALLKVGAIKKAGRAATVQEQRVISQLLRRNMVGAALGYMGANMAKDGVLDEQVQINVKDGYVDYGDLDQIGGPMSIILRSYALTKISQMDITASQKSTLINDVLMSFYGDNPLFGGTEGFIRNFFNPKGDPAREMVKKSLNTVIPAGLREMARRMDSNKFFFGDDNKRTTKPDPDLSYAEQDRLELYKNEAKMRIPGLRQTLPKKGEKKASSASEPVPQIPSDFD